MLIQGNSRSILEQLSTDCLKQVAAWGDYNKLQFAPHKTCSIMLKGKLTRKPMVKFNTITVPVQRTLRNLGVILDDKISFLDHVKTAIASAKTSFEKAARMARVSWGLTFPTSRLYYKSIFLGIACHAASCWAYRCTQRQEICQILLRGQRFPLLAISKAYRTCSTECLPVMLGLTPLDLEVQRRAAIHHLLHGKPAQIGRTTLHPLDSQEFLKVKVKKLCSLTVLTTWQSRWSKSLRGRITYLFFPDIAFRQNATWLSPDHWTSQFITGHGAFNAKLHKFKIKLSPHCPCGDSNQDSEHILWNCPIMSVERGLLFSLCRNNHVGPIGHPDLVSSPENFCHFKKFATSFGEKVYLPCPSPFNP